MHELSHQLSLPDHYCNADIIDSTIGCSNEYCDTCYLGYDDKRKCLMSEFCDIRTENVLYCDSCTETIYNYLVNYSN